MPAGYKIIKESQIYLNGIAIILALISLGVNLDICLEEPGQSPKIATGAYSQNFWSGSLRLKKMCISNNFLVNAFLSELYF